MTRAGERLPDRRVHELQTIDHAFCVLGREATTDLAHPSSWGADCWICDPWAAGINNDIGLGAFSATRFRQVTARTMGNVDRSVRVDAREVSAVPGVRAR